MLDILYFNNISNEVKSAEIDQIQDLLSDKNNLIWLDFEYPSEVWPNEAEINLLQNIFNIHQLNIEDCVVAQHPPKLEETESYIFTILYKITVKENETPNLQEIATFFGDNFVITYRHKEIKEVELVKHNFKVRINHIQKSPAALFYNIADHLVDQYSYCIDYLDLKIDNLEDEIFIYTDQSNIMRRLQDIRSDISNIKRIILAENEIFYNLSRGFYSLIGENEKVFFRDINDHLERNLSRIDIQRDSISGIFEIQMNLSSQKLNDTIKFLTIISTTLLPASLITGIYGMNFTYMPLLSSPYGFTITITFIMFIALIMLSFFKHKKWL